MLNRREQIVQAAVEVVAEQGMAALSVRTIATKVGIGPSTLRHYFPSQRDLYEKVIGAMFNQQLDDLRIRDVTVSAVHRLTECLQQFLPADDSSTSELENWLAIYGLAIGSERTEQGTRLLAFLSQQARDQVDHWIAILATEGVLRSSDNHQQVVLLLSVVNGLCLELITPDCAIDVETARSLLAEVIKCVIVKSE